MDTAPKSWSRGRCARRVESFVHIPCQRGESIHSDHVLRQNAAALDGFWFPNRVGNPKASNQSIHQWFNQLACATPANNTFGNVRRNSLYGPDLSDIDLSMGKTFNIPKWESAHLEIRMDATNFINHPSFELPDNQLSAAALAQASRIQA